jgi:hypothetical protein
MTATHPTPCTPFGWLRCADVNPRASIADVQHAEELREARAEKAARKGEPEPAPVTRIFAPGAS